MKRRIIFKLLAISILIAVFTPLCQGQGVFGKLNEALDNSIDQVADKGLEKVVEAMIEKIFNGENIEADSSKISSIGGSDQDSSSMDDASDFFGLFGSSKKVDKVFDFDYKLDYRISSSDESRDFVKHLSKDGQYVAVEISNIISIVDMETMDNYAIVNGNLTSINIAKMIEKYSVPELDDEEEDYEVITTDEYQNIAGYRCQLTKVTSDEYTMDMWITQDFIHVKQTENPMFNNTGNTPLTGYPIKIIYSDNKGNTTTQEIVKVYEESYSIDLKDY